MNRLFSLRTPVGVIGAVAAFMFSLSACGDDSGSNNESNSNDFSLQVESMDELPNCSKKRLGDIAEVLGERKAYVCDNGRWEFDHDILDSVETEDDLPACFSKNEGDSVWVVDESAVFACIDRKWEKHEKEEPESSSATTKTASSSSKKAKSSSAVASSNSAKSSGSKEQKSSSSKKDGGSEAAMTSSSSSVKKAASSSSKPLSSSIVRSSSSVKQSSSSYIPPVQSSSSMIAVPDDGGGSCAPVKASVPQGENVVWKYAVGGNVNAVDVLSADFKWTTPGGTPESLEGNGPKFLSDSVAYATSGQYKATLALTTSKGSFDINCSPVLVSGAPITGCKCTTSATGAVDFTKSPGVEWSVTGCSTGAGLDLSYEWDGTAAGTSTSYTKVFTAEHPGYTPKLIVKNNDKTMVEVTCPSVKITEGPEFVIKMTGKSGAVDLPRGSSRVILEVDVSSSYYDCVVFCQLDREKANSSTGAINGSVNNVSFRGSDYIEVRLPGSIAAGKSLYFELDVPATCGVR